MAGYLRRTRQAAKFDLMEKAQPSSYSALQKLLGSPPPWLAGVLNVTPDSFSDGGLFAEAEAALRQGLALLDAGAQLIDIGGESTGPGRSAVTAAEELRRIEALVAQLAPRCFVSIDTYKTQTARRCLELGARMINDVSALRAEPDLARIVAEHEAFIVLMYSKEAGTHPHATRQEKEYEDVVSDACTFLEQRVEYALACGIKKERIVIDPGMGGFISPEAAYSWKLLAGLQQIKERFVDFALMIGTSRKGFLGGPLSERDASSQLTAFAAFLKGADIIRTHNVSMAAEFFGRVKNER